MLKAIYPTQTEFEEAKSYAKSEISKLLDINLRDKNPKLDELVARLCFGQENGYQTIASHWNSNAKSEQEFRHIMVRMRVDSHDPDDSFVETYSSNTREGLFLEAYKGFCSDWAIEMFYNELFQDIDGDNPDIFLESFDDKISNFNISNNMKAEAFQALQRGVGRLDKNLLDDWYAERISFSILDFLLDEVFEEMPKRFFVEMYMDFWNEEEHFEIETLKKAY